MIGSNLDTCKRGPPLIKLMGYEHREDSLAVGGSRQSQTHTHTHSVPHDTQGGWSLGQGSDAILTHVGMALPLIKLMGYEHRAVAVGVRKQAMANTHKHTHSVDRDKQGGLGLRQCSKAILTHVGVAPTN